MKKWKNALISYIEYCDENYFIENRLKNLTFPINFNNFYYSKLKDKSKIGVRSIEKNTSELMLIYIKIHKVYNQYKEKDMYKYRYILKTELEHFIIRYRLIVDKLGLLKKDFKNWEFEWSNTDYFTNSEEYNQLLGIRNDIAHESIRSHVFYTEKIQRESFQFYTNRSLDNNICLHNVFLNPHGSEIYDLKRWLTWMLVLLLNYINDIINDIVKAIMDKYDNDSNKLSEIKKYDILVDNKISSLIIDNNEVSLFRSAIDELRNYIIDF